MKIAMVTPAFPPYQGGIGSVAEALAMELSRRSHKVTVLTPDYGLHSDKRTPYEVKWLKSIIRYGNAAFIPQLFKMVAGYDIVHLHYPFFGGLESLGARAKLFPFPLIIHYHHDTVGTGFRKAIFKIHRQIFLTPLIQLATKVIVTSLDYAYQSQIGALVKRWPDKFIVVPNGVDVNHFYPAPVNEKLLDKLDLLNKKVILFVGSLDSAHYFKGVNYLISAVKDLNRDDVALLIIGDGDLRYSYEQLVESYNLQNKVKFLPEINYDQLPDYYRLANCLILPSVDKTEAFGVVLLEAMATARPIIASDLPGVRTVVGSHQQHGLLVRPRDASDLAKKINLLLDNTELANKCGQQGWQTVIQRYAWPVITQEIESIYQQITV